MSDVPSLADEDTSNFATMNAIWNVSTTGNAVRATLTEGNLRASPSASGSWNQGLSTICATSSGKYYAEFKYESGSGDVSIGIGADTFRGPYVLGSGTDSYGYFTNGNKFYNNTGAGVSYGASWGSGDIIGVAFDLDAGTLTFYKNNASQGTAFTGISTTTKWLIGTSVTSSANIVANYGQRPFAYTPPTGFKKLNTFNLPDSTIEDGSEHFVTKLFTGDGSNNRFISTGFSTDFTWLKNTGTTNSHYLSDTVRGNEKAIFSNSTAAEYNYSSVGGLSFATGGITVDTGTSNVFNTSSGSFVTWNWRGSDSTAASNTDGSLTSTVSANPTAGFSIVKVTGTSTGVTTIGHGLGIVPKMILKKTTSHTTNWGVYHASAGASQVGHLNLTNTFSSSGEWGSTTPTTSVFSNYVNNGYTDIFYCFADVEGYSKFGGYTGNGSTDGAFVYTGFRPTWIMVKGVSNGGSWHMWDDKRGPINVNQARLLADTSDAEATISGVNLDMLSNGFKLRNSDGAMNGSARTYVYMAFAENPFKNSNAR